MENFGGNISSKSIEQEYVISSQAKFFESQRQLYQPKAEDFLEEPGYDAEEIKREIATSDRLKKQWGESNSQFEAENKQIADIFEGIIVDQFCGEWMANKAEAFFTADPDDYLRKVDCVIEFLPDEEMEKAEYLGLGIDVTFSMDYTTINDKLDSIWKNDIEKGKQVKVKYVDTEHYKGSMDVFRTVLATNKETVLELARLYKNKEREKLNDHPYLANALFQIKCQLESYYKYALANNLSGGYMREVTKTLATFYKVYTDKEEFLIEHAEEVQKDPSYKMIQAYCYNKIGR